MHTISLTFTNPPFLYRLRTYARRLSDSKFLTSRNKSKAFVDINSDVITFFIFICLSPYSSNTTPLYLMFSQNLITSHVYSFMEDVGYPFFFWTLNGYFNFQTMNIGNSYYKWWINISIMKYSYPQLMYSAE